MEFEWDPGKSARNLRKHTVAFQEAAGVFGDSLGATVPDRAATPSVKTDSLPLGRRIAEDC